MNNWIFFDRKVCLTLDGEEWIMANAEFSSVGLNDVRKFIALPSKLGPHQSFNNSTYQILTDFYDSKDHTLLFLEDDCEFRNLHLLSAILKELPKDFDIFYLGANIRDEKPQRVSQHIYRVNDCWTTHAVVYRKPIVKFILDNHPGESEMMFDNWLGAQLTNWKAYVCKPFLAYQRPRKSAIWNEVVNYEEIFKNSQMKLV
jgi:hypothetical protein